MLKEKSTDILEKKYLSFLATQGINSEPFHNKITQLNKFYLPICKKIYQDYNKKKKNKNYRACRRTRSRQKYNYPNYKINFKKKI